MDIESLLSVKPEDLAKSLLQRRLMLKESLPGVIRNLEAEEEALSPKAERFSKSYEEANSKVAEFKQTRDKAQSEAGVLISEVKLIRKRIDESGGMVNLDPKWRKERLIERIEEIEHKIQTSALDQKSERNLLDKRKALVYQNDKWLKERKDSNPDMLEYIEKSKRMSNLYKKADSFHAKMIEAVKRAQPTYEKSTSAHVELREIRSQLDRARELLKQSDRAIEHWETRLQKGFGDMGPGLPDLLKGHNRVSGGGASSFSKSTKPKSKKSNKPKEEEE